MALRVALVHSFYDSGQPSGENTQVEVERQALERAGFDVALFGARTDDRAAEVFYRVRSALRVATHRGSSPLDALGSFGPDVVHIHNLFPNYGRRWVRELDVPVVVTVHNFRFACAAATLFRDGGVCTDCPDGRPWSAVRHRCYRRSTVATLPLAVGNRRGAAADPVLDRADRILCIFPRQRLLLERAGVDSDRIVPWVNFLPAELVPPERSTTSPDGCVYVGRLTEEKGVVDLVSHWSGEMRLTVVGEGPMRAEVEEAARGRNVVVSRPTDRARVVELLQRSAAFALPSIWPEVMPLTAIEALACGVPIVVRADADTAPPIVDNGVGLAVEHPRSFPDAAAALANDAGAPERCRAVFSARYTEDCWVGRIRELYNGLAADTSDLSRASGPPRQEPQPTEGT